MIRNKEIICLLMIVLIGGFYLLTIRAGTPWADDFAMYISEASNLAHGIPITETGYIYNPQRPSLGPRLYPPVFPALLIPGYLVGGLDNLIPMKVEIVAFFVGLLIVLWQGLGKQLPLSHRAAMLAIVGLNPLLWTFKDLILSDIPFTFLLYLTLALADQLTSGLDRSSGAVLRTSGLGVLVYLCFGTRTIGVVLIPALILLAVRHWKRGGRSIAWAASVGLALCLVQQWYLGARTSYTDQMKPTVQTFSASFVANTWSLATYWGNPYTRIGRDVIFLVATLLAFVAYIRRLREGVSIYEIFFPLYLIAILVFPGVDGTRFLIPVFPIYVFYFLKGAETIEGWQKSGWTKLVLVPTLVAIFVSYGAEFAKVDFRPRHEGFEKREATELISFIRSSTSRDDVIVFRRPRALALFTGRKSSVYPESQSAAVFCSYFQSIQANYIIEARSIDDRSFDEFLERGSLANHVVYSNSDFRVFHLNIGDLEGCARGESLRGGAASFEP